MSSPLVRVPLTLVTAAAFHVSMSPPSPLTSHPDAGKHTYQRTICATARFITTMFTKGVYWASTLTDTMILLAPYLPTVLPITITPSNSSSILSWFSRPVVWIPVPATIQLSLRNFYHLLHSPRFPLLTIVGTTLAVSGALLRSYAFRTLGQFYACTNTGPGPCRPARNSAKRHGHAHALITTGPYTYVRHPGYAGLILCTVGLVALHVEALGTYTSSSAEPSSWGIVDEMVGMGEGGVSVGMRTIALACTILSTVGAIRRIRDEERALKARFKGEWEAWAERVPYKLVPGIY